MRIKKYRPNFFTGFPDEYYEVNSKDELMTCGLISFLDGFTGFSFRSDGGQGILSANYEDGSHWVIALIHNEEDIKTMGEWFKEGESEKLIN